MAREKERHQADVRRRLLDIAGDPPLPASPGLPARSLPLPQVLADVRGLLTLQAVERQVAAVPTWPVDAGMLGRLAAIVTAILTSVLANLIVRALVS
jgi:hypothetical protein